MNLGYRPETLSSPIATIILTWPAEWARLLIVALLRMPPTDRGPRAPQSHWPYSVGFNVHPITGDGQCLYSALGFHCGMGSAQTRTRLYTHAYATRPQMSDMDPTGQLYLELLRQLMDASI